MWHRKKKKKGADASRLHPDSSRRGLIAALVTAAEATATRGAFFARARFIDRQSPATHLRAVQGIDGSLGALFGVHGDEPETTGASAHFVHHQVGLDHVAVFGKEILKIVFGGVEGKISYKQFSITHVMFT